MDEKEKARLAKQGLAAAELLEPGEIKKRMKDSVSEAAGNAALRGLAAIGRLTGSAPERCSAWPRR